VHLEQSKQTHTHASRAHERSNGRRHRRCGGDTRAHDSTHTHNERAGAARQARVGAGIVKGRCGAVGGALSRSHVVIDHDVLGHTLETAQRVAQKNKVHKGRGPCHVSHALDLVAMEVQDPARPIDRGVSQQRGDKANEECGEGVL
jgi:hypothetical protein